MRLTLDELKERLSSQFDEVTLLEILDIKTADIVEAFEDRIAERQEELQLGLEEENEPEEIED